MGKKLCSLSLALCLCLGLSVPAMGAGAAFSDVPEGAWYADAVQWASGAGIVTGMGDGTFAPDAAVTREQMAVFLYRYAQALEQDVTVDGDPLAGFADADTVSAYAVDALRWAAGTGLINGTDSVTLSPRGGATRAQTAAILIRFAEHTR